MRLTNKKIEQLNAKLKEFQSGREKIEKDLQKEYNKLFDADKILEQDLKNTENASMYMAEEDGIYSWFKVKSDLSMFSKTPELKEYLENYVAGHGMRIDWENDCFMNYQGDDNIIIQDDTRYDNGVWQNHKLLFYEGEYKNEDGEVDEEKRNELIEQHMEKTGYFPGVFRMSQYNNEVFPVSTAKKKTETTGTDSHIKGQETR